MSKKQKQQLYTIVARTLAKNKCKIHYLPITQLSLHTFKLQCKQCHTFNHNQAHHHQHQNTCISNNCKCLSISIQQVVKSPIQAAVSYGKQSKKIKQIINLRQLLNNIEEYKHVKIGFQSIITNIKQTVNNYCDKILQQFTNKWNKAFTDSQSILQQIKIAQNRYCRVFQQIIQNKFQQGRKQQFQQAIQQFCGKCSEDPYDYLHQRINKLMKNTQNMPIINWESIKQLHSTITDSSIWQTWKIIKPSFLQNKSCQKQYQQMMKSCNLLLPELPNKLSNIDYSLFFTKQSIKLYKNSQQQKIRQINQPEDSLSQQSQLNQSHSQQSNIQNQEQLQLINQLYQQNDAYYQIQKCRIIGVNYRGITMYRYGIGGLEKCKKYAIAGCQTVLSFTNCLILQAENRIFRLWLNDGFKQVVGLNGSNLKYGNKQDQFCYMNGKGENVVRCAYHNQV